MNKLFFYSKKNAVLSLFDKQNGNNVAKIIGIKMADVDKSITGY